MAFRKKPEQPEPPETPQGPPRWKVPEECSHCGARVDQAVQSRADQPRCRFCSEPLPCEALPPPEQGPNVWQGMVGSWVSGAMAAAQASQQVMAQEWMNQMSQPGAMAAMTNRDPYVNGRGTITSFQDLAADMPEGRLYLVNLDVRVPAGIPFSTSVSTPVPQDCWGKLVVGTECAVKVHPANQSDVKVDWRAV